MKPDEKYYVIYLTGAPATGKSSLCRELSKKLIPLKVIEYGSELTKYINSKISSEFTQEDIRARSSSVITKQDVDDVDRLVVKEIAECRLHSHVIIDSHAVTKEEYGYRVTSFNPTMLSSLNPSFIVNLYTESEIALERISSNSAGRPSITNFEAGMHTQLQSGLSLTYGVLSGVPIYFLDSDVERDILVNWFLEKMN